MTTTTWLRMTQLSKRGLSSLAKQRVDGARRQQAHHQTKAVAAAVSSMLLCFFLGDYGRDESLPSTTTLDGDPVYYERDDDLASARQRMNLSTQAHESPQSYHKFDLLQRTMNPQSCSCSAASATSIDERYSSRGATNTARKQKSPRSSLIQRYRTMKRLDLHSTKDETLEARYRWNKNDILGEGAFGSVFKAYEKATQEPVALKKISRIHTDNECFQREMRALLHVRDSGGHPHVCALRENFDDADFYYLILDYIGGGEMFDHLINNGAYSERDAARLVREVADALSFLHGIGVVHADLKPENILLSTSRRGDSVVKLADFGCSQVLAVDDITLDIPELGKKQTQRRQPKPSYDTPTPAYCPPELMKCEQPISPPMDMWGLGVILYIMLTGAHPFDLEGNASDAEIEERIMDDSYRLPIRNSPYTSHLSPSAIDLIEKLMDRNHARRLTALGMLDHPWVRGETATTDIIAGSDKRLSKFRVFKSKLQTKFFHDVVTWSDRGTDDRTSLIERSFQSLDPDQQGYLELEPLPGETPSSSAGRRTRDVDSNTDESGGPKINMSDFQHLLALNMKNRYFPAGHIVYREGQIGNHMYLISSGTVEVTTKDGSRALRSQGDFFGEGALLHPNKTRSATIRCRTPVNAMEISREYFEKYLANSDRGLYLTLKEKDKIRKRNRARTVLRLQKSLVTKEKRPGDAFFVNGHSGDSMFMLDKGRVDVKANGKDVFSVMPGNVFGEYSLMTGRPRNCTAVCVDKGGCVARELHGRDFRRLIKTSPNVEESLRDLLLRREFKKAVVLRLRQQFPYQDPQQAFDAADEKQLGLLDEESIGSLMRDMNPDYTDKEIEEIIRVLDLSRSGTVSFEEFKKVFVGDIRASASM